jgi:S-adenosyl-L-methionine hydrolase (adenosine-forming)
MIVLFTDFGLEGPYTGQMKAVLHQMVPGMPVVDLFADAPFGDPKASSYLLAAYAGWFPPKTIFLCVVDPGVGGERPALMVEADSRWYVGPGNGLFELIERRAEQSQLGHHLEAGTPLGELPWPGPVRARRRYAGAR